MRVLSLFSGIGGFDLGLERAGMECVGQVENNEFCIKVLEKHWPNVKRIKDIRDVKADSFGTVDIVCGGFPCQPFSVAGKQKGKEDDRYLWPEMLRVISLYKPTWVIGENVAGIINMELENVCLDLESKGYEVQPIVIPACAIGAWHRRDRVWIIAYSTNNGLNRNDQGSGTEGKIVQDTIKSRRGWSGRAKRCDRVSSNTRRFGQAKYEKQTAGIKQQNKINTDTEKSKCKCAGNTNWEESWLEVATRLCRSDDGVSGRVHRLKALGNAVVPQVVEIIGRFIMQVDPTQKER